MSLLQRFRAWREARRFRRFDNQGAALARETDEPDDEPEFTPNLLDTKTAEVAAIIISACIVLGAVIVVAALAGWLPW